MASDEFANVGWEGTLKFVLINPVCLENLTLQRFDVTEHFGGGFLDLHHFKVFKLRVLPNGLFNLGI